VRPGSVRVIPLGVDTRLFHPRSTRVPGRIVAVASADSPVKGVGTLLRAFGKLVAEREAQLIGVGRPAPGGPTGRLSAELSLGQRVRFVHGISDTELAELVAGAEVAVVPSLYEGFSLPAVEHMASGTPLVASRTGALPEVTGDAALLVEPGDAEELAAALRGLLDSPQERARLSAAAWRRVPGRVAWPARAPGAGARDRGAVPAPAPPAGAPGGGKPVRWAPPRGRKLVSRAAPRAPGGLEGKWPVLTVDFGRFPVGPGDRVLDLGCGNGRHAYEAYRRGGDVVACDADEG